MRTVWKYTLDLTGEPQSLSAPAGAEVLYVARQEGGIALWLEVAATDERGATPLAHRHRNRPGSRKTRSTSAPASSAPTSGTSGNLKGRKMTEHAYEDTATLRAELASLRARQEILADALALAAEEMEELKRIKEERDFLLTEVETLRAALDAKAQA